MEGKCLLVAETVLITAIGTLPCNAVAGHTPYIVHRTRLADAETAPTSPAEPKGRTAAVAEKLNGP